MSEQRKRAWWKRVLDPVFAFAFITIVLFMIFCAGACSLSAFRWLAGVPALEQRVKELEQR